MGLEEGFKFKKKKTNKIETAKPKTVKSEYSTEGKVEVYGLEISTSFNTNNTNTNQINNDQSNTKNNKPQKLKIPIIKLKDV